MDDYTLLGIALFTSLAGLAILGYATVTFEASEIAIVDLTEEDLGRVVAVTGVVEGIREFNVYASVQLKEEGSIVVFARKDWFQHVEKGTRLRVEGEVKEYQGELEILPSEKEDIVIIYAVE